LKTIDLKTHTFASEKGGSGCHGDAKVCSGRARDRVYIFGTARWMLCPVDMEFLSAAFARRQCVCVRILFSLVPRGARCKPKMLLRRAAEWD